MTARVRPAVCAGSFYPARPGELRAAVEGYLRGASGGPCPKALIVPHAGYVYSGPIAASAYRRLVAGAARIRRVVLLGPAHFVPLAGLAASSAAAFATPLGEVEVDRAVVERALALPQVVVDDGAHAREHSLEVQLPFLQVALEAFRIVPLVVGSASGREVAEVLAAVWGGDETLVVVSSDLSHDQSDATARRLDRRTSQAIEALAGRRIPQEGACGREGIRGLLYVARRLDLEATTLDLRNSAAIAGPRHGVVGYGAFALGTAGRTAP